VVKDVFVSYQDFEYDISDIIPKSLGSSSKTSKLLYLDNELKLN
jgi:hypothetical protein